MRGMEYYLDAMENGPQLSGIFMQIFKLVVLFYSNSTIITLQFLRLFKKFYFSKGFLPIPPNFTTVGKPQITVNQYDSPLDVYSDDTLEEMKEERLVMQNPDLAERMPPKKNDNPMAAMQARTFDPSKSEVLGVLKSVELVGAPQ